MLNSQTEQADPPEKINTVPCFQSKQPASVRVYSCFFCTGHKPIAAYRWGFIGVCYVQSDMRVISYLVGLNHFPTAFKSKITEFAIKASFSPGLTIHLLMGSKQYIP